MVPKVTRVAYLVNPTNASSIAALEIVQTAAQKVGVKILPVEAGTPQEIGPEFHIALLRHFHLRQLVAELHRTGVDFGVVSLGGENFEFELGHALGGNRRQFGVACNRAGRAPLRPCRIGKRRQKQRREAYRDSVKP